MAATTLSCDSVGWLSQQPRLRAPLYLNGTSDFRHPQAEKFAAPFSSPPDTFALSHTLRISFGRLSPSCPRSQSVCATLIHLIIISLANTFTAGVRENVNQLLEYSLNEKKRNFLETVELQIGLKNYDPQRDKRFSGTIKLPSIPRPNMSIWYVLSSPLDPTTSRFEFWQLSVKDFCVDGQSEISTTNIH